jgi:hypothetical protein
MIRIRDTSNANHTLALRFCSSRLVRHLQCDLAGRGGLTGRLRAIDKGELEDGSAVSQQVHAEEVVGISEFPGLAQR